ncbi:uncharacterized protein LOC116264803 [Nymphaea colorata]|nr:uncharacterized protein LOC116264803 [Nymphaea colorata]
MRLLVGQLQVEYSLLMLLFVVTAVVGLCAAGMEMKKAKKKKKKKDTGLREEEVGGSNWDALKRVLAESVQWGRGVKWVRVGVAEEQGAVGQGRLLEEAEYLEQGEQEGSASPFWQHRILMGERCELPRFSGLILYDEQGRPVHALDRDTRHDQQEKLSARTLKDLL